MQQTILRRPLTYLGNWVLGAAVILQIAGHAATAVAEAEVIEVAAVSQLPAVSSSAPGALHWGGESAASLSSFDLAALPGRLSDPAFRRLWREGMGFELRERLLESARRYEVIAEQVPEESYTYWRISRNYWRHGELLPMEAKQERVHYFELAEEWAGRGIALDPDCAPCMLWKFVSMGRQATTKGLLTAVADAREMGHLLTRGIELRPLHSDGVGNTTLGNLYYAGAVFYRVIPDWFWLRWFIGVQGDRVRSLDYARRAVEIAEVRVDYRVELGAALLCLGTTDGRPAAIVEGSRVLEEAQGLVDYLGTDHLDKAHARILIDSPEKACSYSRDGFIDMDAVLEESKASR